MTDIPWHLTLPNTCCVTSTQSPPHPFLFCQHSYSAPLCHMEQPSSAIVYNIPHLKPGHGAEHRLTEHRAGGVILSTKANCLEVVGGLSDTLKLHRDQSLAIAGLKCKMARLADRLHLFAVRRKGISQRVKTRRGEGPTN